MPDQYGNLTEAEQRAANNPNPGNGPVTAPAIAFDGTIGGHRVTMYGPAPMSREQAMAILQQQNAERASRGAVDVEMWKALNPGASAADLKAYTKLHKSFVQAQGGDGMFDKIKKAVKFEVDRAGNLVKGVANDPSRLLTGVDPLSTKIHNAALGTDKKPLVGQLGGATQEDFQRYEDKNGPHSLGAARAFSHTADAAASMIGGAAAANGLGNAIRAMSGAQPVATTTYQGGANLNFASNAAGASEPLAEVVVTGTRAAGGLSPGAIAGIGAGVVGAGAAAASGGGSSASGMQTTSDPAGSFQNTVPGQGNAGNLANSGGIEGGAGTGGTTEGSLGGSMAGESNGLTDNLGKAASAFSSGGKSPKVKSGKLKKYTNAAALDALQRAQGIADRPYTPYTGERIAGMSGNEELGYNLARDAATNGVTQRLAGKAEDQLDQSTQDFNSENLGKYSNPYKEQVTDIAIRKANEDFENQRSDLRGNLAASDAFGSDRGALLESQMNKSHEENVGDITVKGMSEAFDRASTLFMADSQRRQQAAAAYQSLGNDVTRMNSQQISDLVATGGLDRLLRQANLDSDYEAFIEERDWDVNNLQPLLQTLSVLNKSNMQPGQKEQKNTWSSILGVVGTAVGAYYGNAQAGGAIGAGVGGAVDG